MGIGDDLTGDTGHVGHCAGDDGSGGEGAEKLGLSSQGGSIELGSSKSRSQRELNRIKKAERTGRRRLTMAGLMESPAVWRAATEMLDGDTDVAAAVV